MIISFLMYQDLNNGHMMSEVYPGLTGEELKKEIVSTMGLKGMDEWEEFIEENPSYTLEELLEWYTDNVCEDVSLRQIDSVTGKEV